MLVLKGNFKKVLAERKMNCSGKQSMLVSKECLQKERKIAVGSKKYVSFKREISKRTF